MAASISTQVRSRLDLDALPAKLETSKGGGRGGGWLEMLWSQFEVISNRKMKRANFYRSPRSPRSLKSTCPYLFVIIYQGTDSLKPVPQIY